MLSKRFTDSQQKLWYFNGRKPRLGVQHVTPSAAFWWPHLNTQRTRRDGIERKDLSAETFFAQKLEGPADDLFNQICSVIREGKIPSLNWGARRHLQHFVLFQFKRAMEVRERMWPSDGSSFIASLRPDVERRMGRALTEQEVIDLAAPESIDELVRNGLIRSTALPGVKAFDAMSDLGLTFFVTVREPFIIGSNPVLTGGLGRAMRLEGRDLAFAMALSWDITLGFERIPRETAVCRVRGVLPIRRLNRAVRKQSICFAANSDKAALRYLPAN